MELNNYIDNGNAIEFTLPDTSIIIAVEVIVLNFTVSVRYLPNNLHYTCTYDFHKILS